MKTRIKNYGTIALFVAFSLITTLASANHEKGNGPSAELKYIGSVKNQPVFQLDLTSGDEENFAISIADEYGNTLYSERGKAKTFSRKFRLDTDQIGEGPLTVEIRYFDKSKPEVFVIDRNTRFVEEMNISRH